MIDRLADLLQQNTRKTFVGRESELSQLFGVFDPGQPPVWFIEGIAGVGKSRLLTEFADRASEAGSRVVRIDCRTIEPIADSFLAEVRAASANAGLDLDAVLAAPSSDTSQVVLTFDSYESLHMIDAWMRSQFLPQLPASFRIVFASRFPVDTGWSSAPEWAGLFKRIELGPLSNDESQALLSGFGFSVAEAQSIQRVARGHPLALQLASASGAKSRAGEVEQATIPAMVASLARTYLIDLPDPTDRKVLEAASVVRRVTRPLLAALLPDQDAQESFDRLANLPFVENRADGLITHEVVQNAVSDWLIATDPELHQTFRRRAWRFLRDHEPETGSFWGYTADLLFILRDPKLRESFFPSNSPACQVVPSGPDDWPAIEAICRRYSGDEMVAILEHYWTAYSNATGAVVNINGEIDGYIVRLPADAVLPETARHDPLMREWLAHLERDPLPAGQRALFGRTWLGKETGERPSEVQAAVWIEAKRAYLELRPSLRRMYYCQRDFSIQRDALASLGFVDIGLPETVIDGERHETLMLDFGPGSVDGWISRLVAGEVGVDDSELLDLASRALRVNGAQVPLTKLEFGVMHYLTMRQNSVVSRADLLADVWGTDYQGGSNVVDVVVRSLRVKMGCRAGELETVRGTGYRLARQ